MPIRVYGGLDTAFSSTVLRRVPRSLQRAALSQTPQPFPISEYQGLRVNWYGAVWLSDEYVRQWAPLTCLKGDSLFLAIKIEVECPHLLVSGKLETIVVPVNLLKTLNATDALWREPA
jgi:hypothetical protein